MVLLTSAAVLGLEILVSRLVAPYGGLTLETCIAAIGVALAAIAAGAALGGRLADPDDPRRRPGVSTALGGAQVSAARPTVLALGDCSAHRPASPPPSTSSTSGCSPTRRRRPYFAGVDVVDVKRHQVALLSTVSGGPEVCSGRSMELSHRRLGITDEAFDAVVGHLGATLDDLGVEPTVRDQVAAVLLAQREHIVSAGAPV